MQIDANISTDAIARTAPSAPVLKKPTPEPNPAEVSRTEAPNRAARQEAVPDVATPAPRFSRAASEPDLATFRHSEELNEALQKEKEVRAEQVERAVNLVGQVKWPPTETVRRIASLLAMNIRHAAE